MNFPSEEELRTLDSESLKQIFSSAFSTIFSTTTYEFNTTFYRGRPNWNGKLNKEIELFDNVRELWAPPQEPELRQGRCNAEGQSLFYCTNNPMATLWECKCQPGQKITIGIYECKKNMVPLGIVGANKISLINKDYERIFGKHYHSLNNEEKGQHDFVDSLFQKQDSSFYNATNAISSIFFQDNSSVPYPPGFTPVDNILGLIYSSVAINLNFHNLVLQPEYAKAVLKPVEFNRYTILDRPSPNHFVIELTHSAVDSILENGDIQWKERKPSIIEYITDIPLNH